MSFLVMRLVRAMSMPRSMKRRPEGKLALLAMADDCNDQGSGARITNDRISLEADISPRSVPEVLKELVRERLALVQVEARQHHCRTWQLNLPLIATLIGPRATLSDKDREVADHLRAMQATASLKAPEEQADAPLNERSAMQATASLKAPEEQEMRSGVQDEASRGADARTHSYCSGSSIDRTPPKTAGLSREPGRGGNFPVIVSLARNLLKAGSWVHDGDLFEIASETDLVYALKDECRRLAIDYGDGVDFRVVHSAAAAAWHRHSVISKFGKAKAS